ncbi:MAG TPA: GNAT family N-acetyltransferase [Blastococcus sp.]|nr:GNAT family N-acetyltransferase [Blastococcus sp.]
MHPDHVPPCDVVVAPVMAEDAGELLTLQRAAYATEARIYGDPELPALTQTLSELQAELATATALKACVGHRIVGAVRAHVEGTVLHVGRLTVAPDWQGHGIGSRLLTAVESHHGDQVETAALFTGHLSEANLTMYARRGYREQRREQLRPGVILVHLAKPLSATDGPTR